VARAVDLVGRFGAPSIGVLGVTSGGGVEALVEPKGPPVPDRTDRYDVLTE